MTAPRQRPVFFHLLRLQFPPTALVSIAHRLAGILLFLVLAPAIWLLERSLAGADGFAHAQRLLQGGLGQLLGALLCWALVHHLLGGIRLLLIDAELGVGRQAARRSAWWVLAAGVASFLLVAVWP